MVKREPEKQRPSPKPQSRWEMGGKVKAQSALCPSAPFSDPASPRVSGVSALCPQFLPACPSLQLPHFCGTFLPGPSQCPRAPLPSASGPLPLLTPVVPATGHLLPPGTGLGTPHLQTCLRYLCRWPAPGAARGAALAFRMAL